MFFKRKVLDIGSYDVNGNNRWLFDRCEYTGVDVLPGDNVDVVAKAGQLTYEDGSFDTIISTEAFEHDYDLDNTLRNAVRMLAPGGLLLFTCATTGRVSHGCCRRKPKSSLTARMEEPEWSGHYRNVTVGRVWAIIDFDNTFCHYQFACDLDICDLYFAGIKKGEKR